jgi:small subunit ribosomal protein S6
MAYHYETAFALIPNLSDEQVKETVRKFRKIIRDLGANILHEESWGPQKKSAGYYQLFEFAASGPTVLSGLEIAFKRDERVLRFTTIRLNKLTATDSIKD